MVATVDATWVLLSVLSLAGFLAALRYLMSCRHCGESMLWWSAKTTRSWDLFGAIDRLEACPYCRKPLSE